MVPYGTTQTFGPDAPPPKRILVTGGAGFVGHSIVNQLLDRGLSVRALDPGPPHPRWNQIVDHHRADLLHPTSLTSAIRGIDPIFHTAGLWDGSPGGRERMFRLNVDGTQAVPIPIQRSIPVRRSPAVSGP